MATSNLSPVSIACNLGALTAEEQGRRATLASRLRTCTQKVIETDTGYALRLPEEPAAYREAFELALLERRCCPFLRLELTLESGHGPVWLTLGGAPGVKAFLAVSSLIDRQSTETRPCCS